MHLPAVWDMAAVLRSGGPSCGPHLPRRVQEGRLHHLRGVLDGPREGAAGLRLRHPVHHVRPAAVGAFHLLPVHLGQAEEPRRAGSPDREPGGGSTHAQAQDLPAREPRGGCLWRLLDAHQRFQRTTRHRHRPHRQALLSAHPAALSPVRHELFLLQPLPLRLAARPLPG